MVLCIVCCCPAPTPYLFALVLVILKRTNQPASTSEEHDTRTTFKTRADELLVYLVPGIVHVSYDMMQASGIVHRQRRDAAAAHILLYLVYQVHIKIPAGVIAYVLVRVVSGVTEQHQSPLAPPVQQQQPRISTAVYITDTC